MSLVSSRSARLVAAVVLAACSAHRPARSRPARAEHAAHAERAPRSDLTQARMVEEGYHSVYDAIDALRHVWLFPRGADSFTNPGQVVVYFDEGRLGGIEALRGISPRAVAYVRHYSAVDASARWGVGHTQGVIYLASEP